jgi:hypothetical protein
MNGELRFCNFTYTERRHRAGRFVPGTVSKKAAFALEQLDEKLLTLFAEENGQHLRPTVASLEKSDLKLLTTHFRRLYLHTQGDLMSL